MKAWWFALGGLAFFVRHRCRRMCFRIIFSGCQFGFSAFVLAIDGVLWGLAFFYQKNIGEERA